MPPFPLQELNELVDKIRHAKTSHDKGKALEDYTCKLFSSIPGIRIKATNVQCFFGSEEIDITLWNEMDKSGLYFMTNPIFVECKNWTKKVGAAEVAYFCHKLDVRSQKHGILIAAEGITGDSEDLSAAHQVIADFLARNISTVVIKLDELININSARRMVELFEDKITELTLRRANS